jgi:Uma2 family endonuclease
MRTVVLGESCEIREPIEQRRSTGADLHDEVWEGEYHMPPARNRWRGFADDQLAQILGPLAHRAGLFGSGPFNLGNPLHYRVPDKGYHLDREPKIWVAAAPIVIEIVSPDDERWAKLDFYAAHEVDEVLIVDPQARQATWLARDDTAYAEAEGSALLGITTAELAARIDWPPVS